MGRKRKAPNPPSLLPVNNGFGGGGQRHQRQVSVPTGPYSPAQTVPKIWKGCEQGTWELAPSPCGCHCVISKVGPLGSAAGDLESVTATTPQSGLQEPSREPVPNNEVHLKSPAGGGSQRKRNRSKSGRARKRRKTCRESSGSRQGN